MLTRLRCQVAASQVPIGMSQCHGHPLTSPFGCPSLAGAVASQTSSIPGLTFLFFFIALPRKYVYVLGEEIIMLALNTLGEGGEGRLRDFCLDYLPRTGSSSSSICDVAPMGAGALSAVGCRQQMQFWGVCAPHRRERAKQGVKRILIVIIP